MYFKIRNLRVADVEEIAEPWNFDVSNVDFDLPKEEYRKRYLYNPDANHCLTSMVEGVTPTLRISGKRGDTQNSPYRVHGFCADFDDPCDFDMMFERYKSHPASEYMPTWYIETQSHKMHAVWEFEAPVNVVDLEHTNKFLAEVANRIRVREWGPKYDKKISESAQSYLDIGRRWVRFSNYRIPLSVLHLWDYEVYSTIRKGYASVKTEIPFEEIQNEIRERFPGRFNGIVREGEHCCRFWDQDSDNERGCIFMKDGVRVYVPHDKPFMTWRDIFGTSFVDKYVASKVSPVVQKMWWEGPKKQFWRWKDASQSYVSRNETTLRRDLAYEAHLNPNKKKGELLSEIDDALHDITDRREVMWAAPLLYQPHGLMPLSRADRTMVLNTSTVRVAKPTDDKWTDDWRWDNPAVAEKFPFIHGLISTLFERDPEVAAMRLEKGIRGYPLANEDDNLQLSIFLTWLSYFYKNSAALRPRQGQCLVMAGPRGIGKSFLMRHVMGPLMGGYKDADAYFIDNDKFTGDLVSSPVFGIDDKVADLDKPLRARFTSKLKSIIATGAIRYEEKFLSAVSTVPWMGRVVIVCNLDSKSLSVLPDVDSDNSDKIIMLRLCHCRYAFKSQEENLATVDREIPYFARFLLHYMPREEVLNDRFGVRGFQHPDMVQAANDNGYTRTVIDALSLLIESTKKQALAGGRVVAGGDGEIRGSARTIYDAISEVSPSAAREIHGARNLMNTFEKLMRGGFGIQRIKKRATYEWVIPYNFDERDISNNREEENDGATISL